jgi:hypothetical protein
MRYQLRHHSEEFGCPWCGAPVYVGDSAYQCGPDETPYCSQRCADADHFDAGYGNGGTVGTTNTGEGE